MSDRAPKNLETLSVDLKAHLREMMDRIREREGATIDDVASRLGLSHSLIANSLNPNSRALPRIAHLLTLAGWASYTEAEIDDLKVAIVEWRLARKDGEIHRAMIEAVPKTRRRSLLLDLVPLMIDQDK